MRRISLKILLVGLVVVLAACKDETLQPVSDLRLCRPGEPNIPEKTCIVDGDTLWLQGVNVRLKDVDTPESRTGICGGLDEMALAARATDRLRELLNEGPWTIEAFGIDGTGSRRLATIRIDGEDVGDILIREGLARRWPDGEEFWCS